MIFLRNVLIYFDAPTKVEVVDRGRRLNPGGLFFMGRPRAAWPCPSTAADSRRVPSGDNYRRLTASATHNPVHGPQPATFCPGEITGLPAP